ncbi:MAG: hypothetical protein ACLQBL_27015 [Polyangiaceae bacterium]
MNRQQEQEAIEILLAGNALDDLRALVRNAPREHSLRAMLEFLEGTHEYVAKVMAFIRALEPTLGTSPARVRLRLIDAGELAEPSQKGVPTSSPSSPTKT